MEWCFYGPDAVLIRFAESLGDDTFQRGRALADELERHPPPGLVEFVPAFATVLLEFDPHLQVDIAAMMPDLMARLKKAAKQSLPASSVHEIPIVYDGPDLERVAKLNQLSVEQVCRRHSEPVYKVYCLGFAPGFPYLGDLHASLRTPRLDSPRQRVPAGSVGIGGEHSGIYPVETPAGWNIIGHTPVSLFDRSRQDEDEKGMFLLKPGDRVRFVRVAREEYR